MKKLIPYALMVVFVVGAAMFVYINSFGFAALPRFLLSDAPRTKSPIEAPASQSYQIKGHPLGVFHYLTYYWLEPAPPYPPGVKFPLVVLLHGAPGNAYAAKYFTDPQMQLQNPTFVVVPVLPTWQRWGDPGGLKKNDALEDIVNLIEDAKKKYPIDPQRIYVAGCSEGGIGAFAAARYYPDIFAAAIPMSGMWEPIDGPNMTKVPIWALHGAKDKVFPAGMVSDTVEMIKSYGGHAFYLEFADMDHACSSPALYTPQVWQWLFSQKKVSAPVPVSAAP